MKTLLLTIVLAAATAAIADAAPKHHGKIVSDEIHEVNLPTDDDGYPVLKKDQIIELGPHKIFGFHSHDDALNFNKFIDSGSWQGPDDFDAALKKYHGVRLDTTFHSAIVDNAENDNHLALIDTGSEIYWIGTTGIEKAITK
jgi:hypothetical protein